MQSIVDDAQTWVCQWPIANTHPFTSAGVSKGTEVEEASAAAEEAAAPKKTASKSSAPALVGAAALGAAAVAIPTAIFAGKKDSPAGGFPYHNSTRFCRYCLLAQGTDIFITY